MNKTCEVCDKPIPDDFVNLLCVECYDRQAAENEMRKKDEEEARAIDEPAGKASMSMEDAKIPVPEASNLPQDERKVPEDTQGTTPSENHITDPNYQENPEMEDKEQWLANIKLFERNGVLLWHPTKDMYTFIKDHCMKKAVSHPQYPKFIWKPTIVDVGCGSGIGSNILSQEADFVWGVDKNEKSVMFAKEAFTRVKNGIYYNPQVTFDVVDIVKDTRETMKFDIVVAIEVIEHIADWRTFIKRLVKFDNGNPSQPTEYFISTPNRNNRTIRKDRPYNKFHVREWTGQEFHAALSEFFSKVEFFSTVGEPAPIDTNHTPILARCSI